MARSGRPDRIFEVALEVAKSAGLVRRRRVLDSTPLYDDGYKGHLALDPDSEIITATTVTAANAGDADPAEDLLDDDLPEPASEGGDDTGGDRPATAAMRSAPAAGAAVSPAW